MPPMNSNYRARRRSRRKSPILGVLGKGALWVFSITGISALVIIFVVGLIYSDLLRTLPPIDTIQNWYTAGQDQFPQPIRVLDRKGENEITSMIHPAAEDRQWHYVGSERPPTVPDAVVNALVAAQDATFWRHSGFDSAKSAGAIFELLMGQTESDIYRSIPHRLIEMTILSPEDFFLPQSLRYIKSAVLAQNLVQSYSKDQILEWYVNSVNYGHLSPGIDAAALVYFDKHASDLNLAEGAMLVALVEWPGLDPYLKFASVKKNQGAILARMANAKLITEAEFRIALDESLGLIRRSDENGISLAKFAEQQIFEAIGPVGFQRQGLVIHTSIDYGLQGEVSCVAHIQMERLSGVSLESIVENALNENCHSATYLPPERPGDMGIDHRVGESAIVIVDPKSGEILSYFGEGDSARPPGRMVYPLLYLTAFTRGYSPGSMIFDLPENTGGEAEFGVNQESGQGPIRMRNALVAGYADAARRTLGLVGEDAFLRVTQQLGIKSEAYIDGASDLPLNKILTTSLLDLSFSYGAFANLGTMAGEKTTLGDQSSSLSPILITRIADANGIDLLKVPAITQSIITPSLAYLILNVLSDASARWPLFGRPNVFDLDVPIGVMTEGEGGVASDSWTIGFTPSFIVGVWVGNSDGEDVYRITPENGAAPLWRAVMAYVTSETPLEGWTVPADIIKLDVCDPSGQLPTQFCPLSVQEIFIQGNEPVQYDTLYAPIQINKETGKLATLSTPLDLIEEKVFFIPPPEARLWAEVKGILSPPTEYDAILSTEEPSLGSSIDFPSMFSYSGGSIRVRGRAIVDDFSYYRLEFGEGLNPTTWQLIGDDHFTPKERGFLAVWDTEDLEGLYTLKLLVVAGDGKLKTDTIYVTIDNEPPTVELDEIPDEILVLLDEGTEILIIARAEDNIGITKVEFVVNERVVAVTEGFPYLTEIPLKDEGQNEVYARAYDLAGNVMESEVQVVRVVGE